MTSAVDAFAEKEITDTLRRACGSRTTITIAHRLSSICHCDNIIVLDHGRVAEQGTHQQLLQKPDGIYRRMWQAQHSSYSSSASGNNYDTNGGIAGGTSKSKRSSGDLGQLLLSAQ